jgi:circadian clock protein KaiB
VKRTQRKRKSTNSGPSTEPALVYILQLYITGQTPRSMASVHNISEFCKKHLEGRFELKIVDIYQQPEMAREAQIIAAPTLVKHMPPPVRKLIGDLSDEKRMLIALDVKSTAVRA